MEQQSFADLGLAPNILDIVAKRGFVTPTPIQQRAIPVAVEGKDVIGIAQTGTGKTLAFGLPTLQRLANGPGRALIIAPTRELAYQIEETLVKFGPDLGIQTAVFVGGASMKLQRDMLRKNPRVLVATPGRLIDHLEQKTVSLKEVSVLILDEADRMLDMGFSPQIKRILAHVPKERQTLLFSATMPSEIMEIATKHMHLPLSIEVARPGTAAEKVEQELFIVKRDDKMRILQRLLSEQKGSVLVFSRTKHGAKKITRQLREAGHPAAEIHANRSLAQRREALDGFKSGRYRILVATDIAARGIDVTGIALVINYDLPDNPDDYVHRIGRTGRAGSVGRAVSLAQPDQTDLLRSIEKVIRGSIPRKSMEGMPAVEMPSQPQPQQQRGGGQHRGGGRQQQSHPRGGRPQGGGHRGGHRGGNRGASRPAEFRPHDQRRDQHVPQGDGQVDHGDSDLPPGRHRRGPGDVLGLE